MWSNTNFKGGRYGSFDPGDIDYGQPYKEGDIITVCLDLIQNEISYGRNETQFGEVPGYVIKKTEYRFAIAFYQQNTIVEIVSFEYRHN